MTPDRVGKMGGKRREPSVHRKACPAAAQAFAGAPGSAGGKSSWPGAVRGRGRVIVKTLVSRHKAGKAKGSLTRHAGYLGRDSASADGKPGVFYDASREGVAGRQEVANWAEDRHHFRVIISPERGSDIPDMTAYVRKVMARVEKDLASAGAIEKGTKLEWIAINHHNTDNPHAACLCFAGSKRTGKTWSFLAPIWRTECGAGRRKWPPNCWESDTIEQAQESALKGGRSRAVHVDRPDDRATSGGRKIDLAPSKPIGYGAEDRQLALARLQFLEGIGLAQKKRGTWWTVDEQLSRSLRDSGRSRRCHSATLWQPGQRSRAHAAHGWSGSIKPRNGHRDRQGKRR